MTKSKLSLVLFAILSVHILNAQTNVKQFTNGIKQRSLKKHIYVLASDSCAGRNIDTEGITIARNYIVKHLHSCSELKPYKSDSFLQPFELIKYGSRQINIESEGHKLYRYNDYIYYGKYDNFNKDLPLIFTGYGTEEDFKNMNVKGKAVFILNNNLRASLSSANRAEKYGAEFCIIANPKVINQFQSFSRQIKSYSTSPSYRLMGKEETPVFLKNFKFDYRYINVSSDVVKRVTSESINYWKKEAKKSNYAKYNKESIGSVKISVNRRERDTVTANNIVAYIPGTDSDEYIVVGAHYDHLGTIDNKIYYGADDNASGTAALIEVAKAFDRAYRNGYKPTKSIIFIAFSAEEGGLCGSKYFVDNFKDINKVRLMLNLDMIGRCDNKHANNCNYIYLNSSHLPDDLKQQCTKTCNKYGLTADYSSNLRGSDSKSFSNKGLTTIFFFTGLHKDYHKPSDTKSKIDYGKVTKVSKIVFETIWNSAGVTRQ